MWVSLGKQNPVEEVLEGGNFFQEVPPRKENTMEQKRPKGGVAGRVRELLEPLAAEAGYILWDVEYVREGADWILRVTIDTEEGITVDDCERFTRLIDAPLDEADPIDGSYLLEVSSPGIERSLTRDEHFDYCCGEKVELKLFAPVDGQKTWTGILGGLAEDGGVILTVGDAERVFPRTAVARATTVFDF